MSSVAPSGVRSREDPKLALVDQTGYASIPATPPPRDGTKLALETHADLVRTPDTRPRVTRQGAPSGAPFVFPIDALRQSRSQLRPNPKSVALAPGYPPRRIARTVLSLGDSRLRATEERVGVVEPERFSHWS